MATKGISSKSPTIRRILREAQELASNPSPDFHAAPTEEDLLSWHFTIRGPPSSSFESGIYHGRIVLPPTYPLRPPSFRFMTPTGRFEVNREICLSISGHHEETWMPAWGVRTAMLALRSFMEQPSEGQVGGMDMDDASRRKLAAQSINWKCDECGKTNEEILKETAEAAAKVEGGRKLEDKVPEELKMGYREDIEKQHKGKEVEGGPESAARNARADAALARAGASTNAGPSAPTRGERSEDSLERAVAAREILSHVGVGAPGTRTPPAPTREDAEEIARIETMFPPARPSPIPRGYQSPNQLEPIIGSPPPIYRRPMPGQATPAPTASTSSSFQNDAFPPYMNHPHSRPPSVATSRAGTPLTSSEFLRESRRSPSIQQSNPVASASGTESPHERNANLPPGLVRAQADAAARFFENMGADMHIRQRPITQTLTREEREERLRQEEAALGQPQQVAGFPAPPRNAVPAYQNGQVVWIDRLIVLLATLLGIVVIRFVAMQFPDEPQR